MLFLRPPLRSEVKEIVYRVPEVLFATEITFRRLHRRVAQQELNLLKLAPAGVA
jgi:hypothetical protein